ncbi:hypothetical protein SAMN02745172_00343 [Pseudoxanthobacter soli DSM 19599]|uniref:Uncharacterized protein n=1 Tax=Pseudoxanthobacter soli DSM 19599 TaxID=1123029 RepID=A0A1M7Z6M5_9HYPH|nr:hypothetical protein [Pseudoxanthobacter soli]SHO60583.1 hypothetical protein SAMN02745172_00343 [Pseudoxanthobacter soli DSM 19599]
MKRFAVPVLFLLAAGFWLWGLHDIVSLAVNGEWVSGIPKQRILAEGVVKLIVGVLCCTGGVRLSS